MPASTEGNGWSHADTVQLNGSKEDPLETDSFVLQAMTLIMDEVVRKAGDVSGKVSKCHYLCVLQVLWRSIVVERS